MSVVTEEPETALRTAPRALTRDGPRPLVTNAPAPAGHLLDRLQAAVVPYVSRQVQSVGLTGVAGVALLMFAVAFFIGGNSPLKTELTELQSTLDAGQRVPGPQSVATPASQSELTDFLKHLPTRAELPSLTSQIVAQAATAGIALERGTYDYTVTHSGQMVRARMSFPVHGHYPDIRRFIDGTLAAIPGAAVDALRFERKSVSESEIDAEVRFAFYLRAGT